MKSSKILRKIIAGSMAIAMTAGTGVSTTVGSVIGTNLSVSAADTLSEGNFQYQINDNGTATITKYTGESLTVTIPEKIGNVAVAAIGSDTFRDLQITSVSFPSTLKEIGSYAFYRCKSLKNVTFPSGLEKIGQGAFEECYLFTKIQLPENLSEMGRYAFKNCNAVTSVTLSKVMTSVSYAAFEGTYISEVSIPDAVERIDHYAFYKCRNLQKVSFGENSKLKEIGNYAFAECTSLTGFTVPDTAEQIEYCGFSGCTSLKSFGFGAGMKRIGYESFRYCSSLKNVTLPDTMEYIESNSFRDCISLEWVKLGNGLKRIYSSSFENCTSLQKVWFGTGLERIDNYAFYNNTSLTNFYTIPDKTLYLENYALRCNKWYYNQPDGAVYFGKNLYACKGRAGDVTVKDGTLLIDNRAFKASHQLKSITIPATVKDIDFRDVFDASTTLEAITIADDHEQYKSIDGIVYTKDGTEMIYCPRGKKGTVTVPDETTRLRSYSLRECNSVTTVKFGLNTRYIEVYDFTRMEKLTSITVPTDNLYFSAANGVLYNKGKTYINAYPNAKTGAYTMPDTVTDMYYNVFENVKGITEINVPAATRYFYYSYLINCPTLKAINVNANNQWYSSENGILYNKEKTTIEFVPNAKSGAVAIPDTVTGIESNNTFGNCTALTVVTIPASVTNMSDSCFDSCQSVTKFVVSEDNTRCASENDLLMSKDKNTVYAIPKSAAVVTIPETVTAYHRIRDAAFINCPNLTTLNLSKNFSDFSAYSKFENCPKLTAVNADEDNNTYATVDGVLYNKAKTQLVFVPGGKTGAFNVISSVSSVYDQAFKDAAKLTSVTFPSSFTGTFDLAYTFRNCNALTALNFASNHGSYVTVSGAVLTKDKTELLYVPNGKSGTYTVPSTVVSANSRVFNNCSKLTNIIMPDGFKKISFEVTGLSALANITIGASTEVSNSLSNLTNLTISGYEGSDAELYASRYDVAFNKLANSITLNQTSVETAVGRTVKLTAAFDTTRTTDKTITWKSENGNIAKVASDGTVTAVAQGMTRISATTADGKTVYCNLTVNPVLENTSSLSADKILLGDTITLNASSSGGVRSFRYAMYYKLSSASAWTTINDFKPDVTAQFTPAKTGTYDICIKVRDSDSVIENKYFTVQVNNAIANTSTVSENLITAGESLTISGKSTGGVGEVVYQYDYKLSSASSWTTLTAYSAKANATSFKPSQAGTYTVRVTAKDENGNTAQKTLTVTVTDILANTSTISTDTIVVGDSVTINASATGGKGDYTYAYYYKKFTHKNWTKIADYSTNTTAKATPKDFGYYQICVKVKDKNGTVASEYMNVVVNDKLKNNSTISAETIYLGDTVTLKAAAADGMGGYTYAFYYKKASDTKWTEKQTFSSASSVSIKPASAVKYDVCVKVKDKTGTVEKKFFTVDVKAALKNNSTIAATSVSLGNTLTVNAKAEGGSGSYTYAVLYKKKTDSKWVTKQNFTSNTTVTVKPANIAEYDLCVKVKDSSGTIVKKFFTFKTVAGVKNTSTLSATTLNFGDTLTMTGSATGGTAPYTYGFYYKKASENQWVEKQKFDTNNTVSIKPNKAVEYDVCIKVKDANGVVEKKYFTVTVK